VQVLDAGIGECRLQASRIRPGVLGAAYTALLADVHQKAHVGVL
jgi:hypothetical protein